MQVIGKMIATAHSSSISLLKFKCYTCTCVHDNTQMFARYTKVFFILLRYNGIKIKRCLAVFLQSGPIHCPRNTFKGSYEFASSSIMVR